MSQHDRVAHREQVWLGAHQRGGYISGSEGASDRDSLRIFTRCGWWWCPGFARFNTRVPYLWVCGTVLILFYASCEILFSTDQGFC